MLLILNNQLSGPNIYYTIKDGSRSKLYTDNEEFLCLISFIVIFRLTKTKHYIFFQTFKVACNI